MPTDAFSAQPLSPEHAPEVIALRRGPTSEDRTMALLCHVGGFFSWIILPLVLWLIKRKESRFVDHHGSESINFQLTMTVLYCLLSVAMVFGIAQSANGPGQGSQLVLVSLGLMGLLMLYELVACIRASIAAFRGEEFRYFLCVRMVK